MNGRTALLTILVVAGLFVAWAFHKATEAPVYKPDPSMPAEAAPDSVWAAWRQRNQARRDSINSAIINNAIAREEAREQLKAEEDFLKCLTK